MAGYREWGLELIRRTSTDLPGDIERRIRAAREKEEPGSTPRNVLDVIIENVELARRERTPICQDTGLSSFFLHLPRGVDVEAIKADLIESVRQATREGLLRPNAVDSITGKNTGDNVGVGQPYFFVEIHDGSDIIIELMLKGGGSENVGAQYRLPDTGLKAGRDLAGVERCIIDAVFKAQGFGCAPGILGVCIGGDRANSYIGAKKQLLRPLDDVNANPVLAEMETRLFGELNELGIGPMGFGGRTTVLGVKIGSMHRHPASFFVSIAYCCWADRHRKLIVKNGTPEFA